MEYANCVRCGKMFLRGSSPICGECQKDEELTFQRIKDYLDDHPDNTIGQVAEDTGVPVKKILKLLKDGRLELSAGMAAENVLRCAQCGKSIVTGTLCNSCQVKHSMAISEMLSKNHEQKQALGMYTKSENLKKNNK